MHELTFDSIQQAAAALHIDPIVLRAARELGSIAFVHGRVRAGVLVDFIDENLLDLNAIVRGICVAEDSAPVLRRSKIAQMRRTIAKLSAQATPAKRHRGREIAAAVRRELTDDMAARIAGMDPGAAVTELAQLRERILAA